MTKSGKNRTLKTAGMPHPRALFGIKARPPAKKQNHPEPSQPVKAVPPAISSGLPVTRVQCSLLGGELMKEIGIMLLLTATSALSLAAQKSVEHVKTYTPDAIHCPLGCGPECFTFWSSISSSRRRSNKAGGLHNAVENVGRIQDPAPPPSSSRARDGDLRNV